jgi:hypothetical protein
VSQLAEGHLTLGVQLGKPHVVCERPENFTLPVLEDIRVDPLLDKVQRPSPDKTAEDPVVPASITRVSSRPRLSPAVEPGSNPLGRSRSLVHRPFLRLEITTRHLGERAPPKD